MRAARILAASIALLALAESARGVPSPRAHLIYVRELGAERCPDEESVRAAVAARLGYQPFSPGAPRTVTVTVRGDEHGLVAHVELSDALGEVNGVRRITSPRRDCGELASALELAVAIAIDPLSLIRPDGAPPVDRPDAVEVAPPPTLPVLPPASSATTPPSPPPSPRRPVPPPAERTRIFAGVGALLAIGTAPALAAAGFTLTFAFRQSAWSVAVELRADLPAGTSAGGGRVSSMLATGGLVACVHGKVFHLGRREVEAAGCGIVAAGIQIDSGEGFDRENRTLVAPYVAVGGRFALEVPLAGPLAACVHADLLVPTYRSDFQVLRNGAAETVFSTPPVSAAVGVSLRAYFR